MGSGTVGGREDRSFRQKPPLMLTRFCWPLRSITTELPLAELRRQPVEPIASPTDALVELPPIWKMAEPLWPGTCTTPTSSGSPPSAPAG